MAQTDKIKAMTKTYHDDMDAYKKYAEARRNSQTFTQEMLWTLYQQAKDYFIKCIEDGKPLTIGGLTLALGVTRKALKQMRDGDFDGRLFQYISMYGIDESEIQTENDEFFRGYNPLKYITDEAGNRVMMMMYSEVVETLIAVVEADCEEGLFGSKPVGRIYYLKAVFGLTDQPHTAPIETDTFVPDREAAEQSLLTLIDEEAAKRAMLMIEADKIEAATKKKYKELKKNINEDE